MKINCIGLGYVGLPTSLLLAKKNFDVVGVDVDEKKIKKINSHNLFFNEIDLRDLYSKVLKKNNFKAKSSPEEGDVFFIVVPTPVNSDKSYDLSFLNSAVDSVIPFLKEGNILIIESTVPVKTTQLISEKIFKARKDLEGKIYVAYCPERVLPGNTLYELKNNDRVIGGINKISTQKVINFYREFVDGNLYEVEIDQASRRGPGKKRDSSSRGRPTSGLISSAIPGKIVSVLVSEGDKVDSSSVVIVLEAMKMQNEIKAGIDGKVEKIMCEPGQRIEANVPLMEIVDSKKEVE